MDGIRKSANIPTYVKLVSDDHMGLDDARLWFKTLMRAAPQGIMTSIENIDANGNQSSTRMIRRSLPKKDVQGGIDYGSVSTELIVPLTRDLLPEELSKIAAAWKDVSPSGTYQISTNPSQNQKLNQAVSGLSLSNDEYQALCLQLAKVQHEGWVRDKVDQGWRYGMVLNLTNKTHPLLRPWEDLPEKYRDVNTDNPENLLNMLNNQGYAVVRQQELGSLMRILRSIS